MSKVRDAITAESLSELTAWLAKMSELGLEAKPEFAEGSTLRDKLLEKNKAREALAAATQERDLGTLQSAIVKAEIGCAGDELTAAQKLVEQLKKEQEAEAKLQSACDGRDLSQVKAAVAEAEGLGLQESQSSTLAAAKELLEQLNAEAACREALKAATASNDGTQLSRHSLRRPNSTSRRRSRRCAHRVQGPWRTVAGAHRARRRSSIWRPCSY